MDAGIEAKLGEPAQPIGAGEDPEEVAVELGVDLAVGFAEDEGEDHLAGRVGGIGVPGPFEVAEGAAVGTVVAAVIGGGLKGLADEIGHDDDSASGSAMAVGVGESGAQGGLIGRVHDGVVDEDAVEGAAEVEGAHIAGDVLAFGIDGAADVEHGRGEIGEGEGEVGFEVSGEAAAAGAEFEQGEGGAGL